MLTKTLKRFGIDQIPEGIAFAEEEMFHRQVIEALHGRMSQGLAAYRDTSKMLTRLGYTSEELANIRTTAAWDYGRACNVARWCYTAKYLKWDEVWLIMKRAGTGASKQYASWRAYHAIKP